MTETQEKQINTNDSEFVEIFLPKFELSIAVRNSPLLREFRLCTAKEAASLQERLNESLRDVRADVDLTGTSIVERNRWTHLTRRIRDLAFRDSCSPRRVTPSPCRAGRSNN